MNPHRCNFRLRASLLFALAGVSPACADRPAASAPQPLAAPARQVAASDEKAEAPSPSLASNASNTPEPTPAKIATAPVSKPKSSLGQVTRPVGPSVERAASKSATAKAPPTKPTTSSVDPLPEPAAHAPMVHDSPAPSEAARPVGTSSTGTPSASTNARPTTKVVVPATAHVRVDVPTGLQRWLDEDDRMIPWLSKAVGAVDTCYAKLRADNPSASGIVSFSLTMHENSRPSAKPTSVPSALQPMVLCVSTQLLAVKMPLFTGQEGASYPVHVQLSP